MGMMSLGMVSMPNDRGAVMTAHHLTVIAGADPYRHPPACPGDHSPHSAGTGPRIEPGDNGVERSLA
jgi:hypothetical protein